MREPLFSISEIIKQLPVQRTRSTINRWILTGFITASGKRVRLKVLRIGNRRYVTVRDFDRFLREMNQ